MIQPVEEIIQEGEALLIPPFNHRNRLNNLKLFHFLPKFMNLISCLFIVS
jgi:hypothetical protein